MSCSGIPRLKAHVTLRIFTGLELGSGFGPETVRYGTAEHALPKTRPPASPPYHSAAPGNPPRSNPHRPQASVPSLSASPDTITCHATDTSKALQTWSAGDVLEEIGEEILPRLGIETSLASASAPAPLDSNGTIQASATPAQKNYCGAI